MKRIIALFSVLFAVALASAAYAQDDRLVGNWTVVNAPIAIPSSAQLAITKTTSGYSGSPVQTLQIPAPINCEAKAGDQLLDLAPKSQSLYTLSVFFYTPGDCTLQPLIAFDLAITFSPDGKSFIACKDDNACSVWTRVTKDSGSISSKTVPVPPSAVGGKKSISVSWNTTPGAYAYRVVIKGPIALGRTVKKGLFTKFTNLPAGNYKVYISGFFKDSANKVQSTKSSPAAKVKVS